MRFRDLQPELMDDPRLAPDEHRVALHNLARLNRLSRAARILWPFVRAASSDSPNDGAGRLSVLDVASGSADVPIALALLARPSVPLAMSACDTSAVAMSAAAERARASGVELALEQRDVLAAGLAQPDASVDVVMCSLFLHHLTAEQAVRVLSEMRRVARRLVLVSDLRRCNSGLCAAYLASRCATRSRVVRVDAVRSVRAAFTIDELRALGARAGMPDGRVLPRWPFRMLLVWTGVPTHTRPEQA